MVKSSVSIKTDWSAADNVQFEKMKKSSELDIRPDGIYFRISTEGKENEFVILKHIGDRDYLGEFVWREVTNRILEGTEYTLSDRSAHLTTTKFLQMILNHAWSRGLRPSKR